MQKKAQIVDRCEHCHGQAYIFECEATNHKGEVYDKYKPCPCCNGTGKVTHWISLREFARMLDQAIAFAPDYDSQGEEPITAYQDSRDAAELP